MTGWQPIETAPKDGSRILVAGCCFGPMVRIVSWGAGRYDRRQNMYEPDWVDGPSFGFAPTHWMPLPSAPDRLQGEDAGV